MELFEPAYYCVVAALFWVGNLLLPSYITSLYSFAGSAFLGVIITYYTYPVAKRWFRRKRVISRNKAVLITGCDSGFGNELARRLDSKGYRVFAGCLFPKGEGAQNLVQKCSSRLQVLELDVTKDESVAGALEFVKNNLNTSELWAIVNNAGVLKGFQVAWSQMKSFQDCLEVNTLGPVRVTKAFLPLLVNSKGRVVNVTSIGGRIPIPGFTPYVMSKFAACAFSDCLLCELEPLGIKVISVEPEAYQTKMSTLEAYEGELCHTVRNLDADMKAIYGDEYFKALEKIADYAEIASRKTYQVIDSLEDAISLQHPQNIYRPRRNIMVHLGLRLYENLPLPVKRTIIKMTYDLIKYPKPRIM